MKRNDQNAFGDSLRGVASIKLPQELRSEVVPSPRLGQVVVTLTLTHVEPAPFGKKLICKYTLVAKCKVSNEALKGLGFHAPRLRRLGLVPDWVPIVETEVSREVADEKTDKLEEELFSSFKKWLFRQKFEKRIITHLSQHIQNGRVSRFASDEEVNK